MKQYANSRGVQIIGDTLYVASDSVDVWAHREMFLPDRWKTECGRRGSTRCIFRERSGKAVRIMTGTSWKRMDLHGGKARMLENMEII